MTNWTRVRCRAVFLDAGGVLVLPHRDLVRAALEAVEIVVDAALVPRAHYRAVRQLDGGHGAPASETYFAAFCRALGIAPERLCDATNALSDLADRRSSRQILWSEPTPHAQPTMDALRRAGIKVLVVTNSDGHAAENLRDARICQVTAGEGAVVSGVIDSAVVGSAKPDPRIFRAALDHARVAPSAVVHVGDMVSADVLGARAAGIMPIHLDPYRCCRASDHQHIRALNGIWRHVSPYG